MHGSQGGAQRSLRCIRLFSTNKRVVAGRRASAGQNGPLARKAQARSHWLRGGWGALVSVIATGCTWQVIPPAQVEQPAHIYVSEYGRHTRLALPREPSGAPETAQMIEYGFGDWNYYALEERGARSAWRALFRSGASALSRREVRYQPDPELFRRANAASYAVRLTVGQSQVDALRNRLEREWNELGPKHRTVRRSDDGVYLRRSDRRYHLFQNSNHQTAEWLRELGCEVKGVAILSRFEVVSRHQPAAVPQAESARVRE